MSKPVQLQLDQRPTCTYCNNDINDSDCSNWWHSKMRTAVPATRRKYPAAPLRLWPVEYCVSKVRSSVRYTAPNTNQYSTFISRLGSVWTELLARRAPLGLKLPCVAPLCPHRQRRHEAVFHSQHVCCSACSGRRYGSQETRCERASVACPHVLVGAWLRETTVSIKYTCLCP